METFLNLLIPLFFLAVACVLLWMHAKTWRVGQLATDPQEREYRRRQYRRRMQTSGLLAVAAVALAVGQWIPKTAPKAVHVVFWAGVVLLVMWIILLAIADMVAIYRYYGRLRTDYLIQRAQLQSQLRRIQSARGNGHDTLPRHSTPAKEPPAESQ